VFYGIWNDVDGCFDLFVVCQRTALGQATVRVRETAGDVTHRGLALQRLGSVQRGLTFAVGRYREGSYSR
jgi:hypothetical protein